MNRSKQIILDAIDGLVEYYACLSDTTLAKEFASSIKVPETGNDQADYQVVRDQLEQMCREHEETFGLP